jgi:hypothetical protein
MGGKGVNLFALGGLDTDAGAGEVGLEWEGAEQGRGEEGDVGRLLTPLVLAALRLRLCFKIQSRL